MGLIQRSCTFRSCVDHADLGACRAWPGPPPGPCPPLPSPQASRGLTSCGLSSACRGSHSLAVPSQRGLSGWD